MKPDPDEFVEFLSLLTDQAPDGYTPWLFRVQEGSKAPALEYGSWKDESARVTRHEAVEWMESGGNVGIAGRPDDVLINVDIDDEDETTVEDLKPTLIARSRSRTGVHAWYFEAPGADIPNIPTDDAGEVRANWQYVVAPGSYVETEPDDVPDDEREQAGYYTVERADPVTSIRLEELPSVFQAHNNADADKQEILTPDEGEFEPSDGGGQQSGLFNISALDVVQKEGGSTKPGDRWSALFHGSDTGENMSMSSDGFLHCWRHEVTHNGLQALCVLSDYFGRCQDVGTGHKHSGAGSSCLHREDGAHIWHAWVYAKQNGYLPDDDPVPYAALKHLCRERELCPVSEIPDEYDADDENGRLPAYAYNAAIESIDGHDELDPGRARTDEFDDGGAKLDAVVESEPDGESEIGGDEQPPEHAPEAPTPESQTDGGTAVASGDSAGPTAGPRSLEDRIRAAIAAAENDDIQQKTARHRIASAIAEEHQFVYPETEVRGWRSTLYVYNDAEGVYEPRGEAFIEKVIERHAGDYVTNQVTNEIIGKIQRRSIERGDAFMPHPARLVVGNGILDLRSGELDRWSAHEYHRTKIDIDWNPDAGEPDAVQDFFTDIVDGRDVDTLYRLIAHSLYKEYVGEKAAMLIGGGQNGKSVFLEFVEQFIGEYNVSHRALQDFDDNRFAANQLEGKLANIHPDMGDESVKDLSTFKKLTGRDTMTADVKYEDPVIFENYATLMFAANEMPVFNEDNHAVWRRWLYIEFPYTFDERDPDAKDPEPKRVLMDRLTDDAQLEALLVRCQEEIEAWHEGREWYPDAMQPEDVREQMKRAAEPVYDFAMTCLNPVDDEDVWLPKEDVRTAYSEYATANQLPKMGAEKFGKQLMGVADLQIENGRPRDGNGNRPHAYIGVSWTERGRQLMGLDEPDSSDDQTTVDENGVDSTKQTVVEIVQQLVAENDTDPVSRDMVVGRAMAHMGKDAAERRIDDLLSEGRLYEPETDKLIDV